MCSVMKKCCHAHSHLHTRPGGTFFKPPGLYFNPPFETTGTFKQHLFWSLWKLSNSQKSPGLVPVVPPVPPGLICKPKKYQYQGIGHIHMNLKHRETIFLGFINGQNCTFCFKQHKILKSLSDFTYLPMQWQLKIAKDLLLTKYLAYITITKGRFL